MKTREFMNMGIEHGPVMAAAREAAKAAGNAGLDHDAIVASVQSLLKNPRAFVGDPIFGGLAEAVVTVPVKPALRSAPAPFRQWGRDLDRESIDQMRNACALPVSVLGALMPDAHVGYGLPIGGVLATRNAVIPYAVGVDIACRMKMTVLDVPLLALSQDQDTLKKAIAEETRFGIGAAFKNRRQHAVMDADWRVSPITQTGKDKAWAQLGTSGSGNHFVEFGELEVLDAQAGLAPGRYLALLSHSGSRGTGAAVCNHYSKLAMKQHGELPNAIKQLAWLDLNSDIGQEYWEAMNLMGQYAAANHACIHHHVARHLGTEVMLDIENHHNFAWKERHDGEELIVHRKGATPAADGVIGIIPGSMATPGFIVRGKGNAESLNSAAHGAGRAMSRTQARKTMSWREAHQQLANANVTLISAGLDEVPNVYKNIESVMAAQADLVDILAKFHPRLVKMAPPGERPED